MPDERCVGDVCVGKAAAPMVARTDPPPVRLDSCHTSAIKQFYTLVGERSPHGGGPSLGTPAMIFGVGNAMAVDRVLRAPADACRWQTDRPSSTAEGKIRGWEGDLVVGPGQSGIVATHVDRRSCFLLAGKVL